MNFLLSYSDPSAAFRPIAEARVLYFYIIQQIVSAALPRSRAVAICRTGMERENGSNAVKELTSSVIVLVQPFIFVWTDSCIPTLNSCDNPYLK